MPWVRLDDAFPRHRKVRRIPPAAGWLHVCALCWCSEHLTDGVVPADEVCDVSDLTAAQVRTAVGVLVKRGLWEKVGDSYQIHDYLDYNPSRSDVEKQRAAKTERQQRWRDSKRRRGVDASTGRLDGVTGRRPVDAAPRARVAHSRPDPVGVGSGREWDSPSVTRADSPVDNSGSPQLRVVPEPPCSIRGHRILANGICASCEADRKARNTG